MEDLLRLHSPSTTSTFLRLQPNGVRIPRSPAVRLAAILPATKPLKELTLPSSPDFTFLSDVGSTVRLLRAVGLCPPEIHRAVGMCPEILSVGTTAVAASMAFLLKEAGVPPAALPRVIRQRPRLLVSDVSGRLRPTLFFLRSLHVSDFARHGALLCFGVEERLQPRLDFLKGVGMDPHDARVIARRFPDIFRLSLEANLEPKFDFFSFEMRRDLRELRDFPEYFSYSLQDRIAPRHRLCTEKGVFLPLPAMLRPKESDFAARLEVCVGSSPPLAGSPLSGQRPRRRRR